MVINMNLGQDIYDIIVERGILSEVENHLDLKRRVLIVTDSGVPEVYAKTVSDKCLDPVIVTIEQGEKSKSFTVLENLVNTMLEHKFSRKDCVVAVGGGVVGDLSGFAAAVYMRGIDFYNIPTTLLSQIDSSIGGKTAINSGEIKNVVGAFYQPKKVLIDPDVLNTLDKRQFSSGLAEAVKMALTSDETLFELIETKDVNENLDEIIIRCLNVKKSVVEKDEKETGLRKILNFGHTVGHGIEVTSNLYHGESVAIGLVPMCDKSIRTRVVNVLKKCNLFNLVDFDWQKIFEAVLHDKKADSDTVSVITVAKIGSFEIKRMTCLEAVNTAKACLEDMK